jgi:hypothetical protein
MSGFGCGVRNATMSTAPRSRETRNRPCVAEGKDITFRTAPAVVACERFDVGPKPRTHE